MLYVLSTKGIQVLCPVFSRKVFFRGHYYIAYTNTFRYKHDVSNNSNTDHWCNLREKKTKNTELWQYRTDDLPDQSAKPKSLSHRFPLHTISACPQEKYIKFSKGIVESYKLIVWAEPRPISMLQNVSHLSNNHLFLPHTLLCGLGVYTWAATTLDEIAVYS